MKECYFDLGRDCGCLVEKKCSGCHFRKTREEVFEGRKKSMDRLKELCSYVRFYEKYHGSFNPEEQSGE